MSVLQSWSHETSLAAQVISASRARVFVSQHLLDHRMGSLVDDVQLVVSELVTNALLHANPPFTVILAAFERTVRLEVLDGGSYLVPSLVVAQSLETTGRGVAIVEAMSRDWGVTSGSSGGKSVWAEFDIPGATHG